MHDRRLRSSSAAVLSASLSLLAASCRDDAEPTEDAEVAASTRNHLVWKRQHALEQDLARGLELDPRQMCRELGQFDCVQQVHLMALGGHDPFGQARYEPAAQPLVTTSLAVDRLALSACARRVELDREDPVVFTGLDLDAQAPAPDSAAVERTVTTLYQRLLGREPTSGEVDVLAELVADAQRPISGAQFAQLSCFAVATTTEFLFF